MAQLRSIQCHCLSTLHQKVSRQDSPGQLVGLCYHRKRFLAVSVCMPRRVETACWVSLREKGYSIISFAYLHFKAAGFWSCGGDGIWLPAWPSLEGQWWRWRWGFAEAKIQHVWWMGCNSPVWATRTWEGAHAGRGVRQEKSHCSFRKKRINLWQSYF